MEKDEMPGWLQTLWNVDPRLAQDAEKYILKLEQQLKEINGLLGKLTE